MSVPNRIDDGDFTRAQQNGEYSQEQPFASKGDFYTTLYSVPMRVDTRFYNPNPKSSQRQFPRGVCYLVDIESQQQVANSQLTDYIEIYATLPPSRPEYQSVTWDADIIRVVDNVKVGTFTGVVDGLVLYEYSLGSPLPALFRAYRDDSIGLRIPGSGPQGRNPTYQGRILAENSTSENWMGDIFVRKSVYIKPPPFTFVPPAP